MSAKRRRNGGSYGVRKVRRTYRYVRPGARAPPIRRYVQRTQGPFSVSESHYFDAFASAFAVGEGTAWANTHDVMKGTICIPTEGSDINNRVGRRVEVYKIAVKGVITRTVSSDVGDVIAEPAFRVIVYQDKQTNATVTNASVLMAAPGAATAPLLFNTFQNTANLGRFRVLKDFVIEPNTLVAGTDGANTLSVQGADYPFKCTIKFKKPLKIRFNGTNGGGIGDIVDHSFYLAIAKSNGNGNHIVSVQTRAYYKDA